MKKILLLEDDSSLSRGISFKLKREGYEVFTASTLRAAFEIFNNNKIDLIISDVGLEDGNGFDFCKSIREKSNVMLIFLTALDQEVDIVTGYDLGADDYITKPFSLMILMSKVNALMRRVNEDNKYVNDKKEIVCKDIAFNLDEMKLFKGGEEVVLSKNEFKLLKHLITNSQQILSKEQLLSALWDIDGQFVDENTVAVNIRRLREKVEDNPSKPIFIKNVRGIGYRWSEECETK